jgi:hypothetical protein
MATKTKSPKLKVTNDYITLTLPTGNYTVSFNGRKVSGELVMMEGAFKSLNDYVDRESKAKSYGEVMNQLTDPSILSKLVPTWDKPTEIDSFVKGDKALFSPNAKAFIKKYGNGTFEVVGTKGKYVHLKTMAGVIGFPKINVKKIK